MRLRKSKNSCKYTKLQTFKHTQIIVNDILNDKKDKSLKKQSDLIKSKFNKKLWKQLWYVFYIKTL